MREESLPPWRTHDWKVRTIESIAPGGGSRLAFTCRSCGRIFNQTTINSRTWAVDEGGVALNDTVTTAGSRKAAHANRRTETRTTASFSRTVPRCKIRTFLVVFSKGWRD